MLLSLSAATSPYSEEDKSLYNTKSIGITYYFHVCEKSKHPSPTHLILASNAY